MSVIFEHDLTCSSALFFTVSSALNLEQLCSFSLVFDFYQNLSFLQKIQCEGSITELEPVLSLPLRLRGFSSIVFLGFFAILCNCFLCVNVDLHYDGTSLSHLATHFL